MKDIRKVVGIIMVLCIIIGGMTTQSYADNLLDNTVQFDEFISRVRCLYEKHGIEIEAVDSTDFTPISRVEFEKYLETMENHLQNTDYSNVDVVSHVREIDLSKEDNNKISPAAIMPVSEDFGDIITVLGKFKTPYSFVPARVDIIFSIDATYDANRREFISIDDKSWYKSDSINLEGLDCNVKASINKDRKSIGCNVSGKAYFTYTDPALNYTIKTTEPFSVSFIFFIK